MHKEMNMPQTSNKQNEVIDTCATLYGNEELVGLETYSRKGDDGCTEENMTSTSEQMGTKQEIHRDM